MVFQLGNVQGKDRNDVDHSEKYKGSSQSKCPGETRRGVINGKSIKGVELRQASNFS